MSDLPVLLPPQRIAPVQGYSAGIPWSLHLEAYDAYCKKYSPQVELIEGWCRGGFGVRELDEFIPGWRDRASEIGRLRVCMASLQERVRELETSVNDWLFAASPNGWIEALRKRAEAAESELARLKAQEPVAWYDPADFTRTTSTRTEKEHTPLYAHLKAAHENV